MLIPLLLLTAHTLTNMATSYVLLTPYNYNDYDVSMESQNSVVLNPSLPGQPWIATGHIEEKQCRPPPAEAFRYDGLMELHLEGEEASMSMEMETMRDGESFGGSRLPQRLSNILTEIFYGFDQPNKFMGSGRTYNLFGVIKFWCGVVFRRCSVAWDNKSNSSFGQKTNIELKVVYSSISNPLVLVFKLSPLNSHASITNRG